MHWLAFVPRRPQHVTPPRLRNCVPPLCCAGFLNGWGHLAPPSSACAGPQTFVGTGAEHAMPCPHPFSGVVAVQLVSCLALLWIIWDCLPPASPFHFFYYSGASTARGRLPLPSPIPYGCLSERCCQAATEDVVMGGAISCCGGSGVPPSHVYVQPKESDPATQVPFASASHCCWSSPAGAVRISRSGIHSHPQLYRNTHCKGDVSWGSDDGCTDFQRQRTSFLPCQCSIENISSLKDARHIQLAVCHVVG